jgi:CIC family chloride channel protein
VPATKPSQASLWWRRLTSRRRWRISIIRFWRNDQVLLFALAVVVGTAVGLAAIAFRLAIGGFQFLGFGFSHENVVSGLSFLPWWQIVTVPTAGGLIVGLMVYFFMPERRPQGVADVIESVALKAGRMELLTGLKAAVVSAASIGAGASVGREGPVVHLGASLASFVGQRLRLDRRLSRTLLGCGVAAAVAASFNAPIAGIFFALEVVVGHHALSAFAPIVIAGVCGTVISRAYYGDFPAFILPESHAITSLWEIPAFAILGIVCAVAAQTMMGSIFLTDSLVRRTPLPVWLRPMLGGLAVGLIALVFPEVLGVGYQATDAALREEYGLWLLIALALAKILATALSLGFGFGGGVFSPSLVIGAMVGGAYGLIAASVFPELASDQGAYTIIGMGAVAGAVLGAPVSTIIIIFEMTGEYPITIALLIATAVASSIVQQVQGRSFFTWLLFRRGIDINDVQGLGLLRGVRLRGLIDGAFASVPPDADLERLRRALVAAPSGELLVVDDDGRLLGTIGYAELSEAVFDPAADRALSAAELVCRDPPLLTADDSLEAAIRVFQATGKVHIPAVENRDSLRPLGFVHEYEVMDAYHSALIVTRAEERGERAPRSVERRGPGAGGGWD